MRKLSCLALLSVLTAAQVQADTLLGFTAGIELWNVDSSGSISDISEADLQFFDLGTEVKGVASIAFEHPVPLVPNLKVRTNDLSSEGDMVLSENFRYAGMTFSAGREVNVEFDMQSTDFVFYYELFDNDLVSFDFGLNLKYLDGDIRVEDVETSQASQDRFKGYVPMLYGAAQIGIPATPLWVYGDINVLSVGDHTLQDYQLGLAYSVIDNLAMDLRLKGGYRSFFLELDDLDGVYTDWDFDGFYLGLEVDF
ncbi:MAG: TIGR04219 family outer membrane beta-barrel protein [Chromatiales bacterium]|nr:TIGR04219 family outer membrane beta-barrel protein [Chromatiales bacterium]